WKWKSVKPIATGIPNSESSCAFVPHSMPRADHYLSFFLMVTTSIARVRSIVFMMPSRRVKFFNTNHGFGFILSDVCSHARVVHVHEVETAGMNTLVAGQLLAYDIGTARDGRSKAVNLRLLNPER